jgi:hypothetical protein
MAAPEADFDPYLKWLGIRAQQRPPDHYRLLGLELFESEPDVISTAADARMLHVKTFQGGTHAGMSQRLLNEIAAAKVCLLNPEKKAAYDRALRQRLAEAATFESPVLIEPPRLPSAGTVARAGNGRSSLARKLAAGVAVAMALLIGSGVWLFQSAIEPQVAKPVVAERPPESAWALSSSNPGGSGDGEHPVGISTTVAPAPVDSTKPAQHPTPASLPEEDRLAPKTPKVESLADAPGTTSPPASPTVEMPPRSREPSSSPSEVADMADAPSPSKRPLRRSKPPQHEVADQAVRPNLRLPEPEDTVQKTTEKRLRTELAGELGRVKRPEDRLALAEKLFTRGLQGENDPAARYVLLRMACEMALAAGELPRTFEAVDEIANMYDIHPLEVKLDLLTRTAATSRSLPGLPATALEWTEAAVLLTDEAFSSGEPELAEKGLRLIRLVAKKARAPQLAMTALAREKDLEGVRQEQAAFLEAETTLGKDPNHAAANFTVGCWHCFVQNDWHKGLPYLARCQHARLRGLAEQELEAPDQPAEQFALGSAWFQLSQTETRFKAPMMARAAFWLRRSKERAALDALPRIDKLLAEIVPQLPPWLDRSGAVRPGVNVALAAHGAQAVSTAGSAAGLNDGVIPLTVAQSGVASASSEPCEWIVSLSQVFRLREIRVKFPEGKNALYGYSLETSADGTAFRPLVTQQQGAGWQIVRFLPRPVKAIKLVGHFHTAGPRFYVSEIEAYTSGLAYHR